MLVLVVRLLILGLFLLQGCGLPSADGSRDDARSSLLSYFQAWQQQDFAALWTMTCASDKQAIEGLKKKNLELASKAKNLGLSHQVKPLHEGAILSALLGKAPGDLDLNLATRLALKRSHLSDEGVIQGWSLSLEGANYFVCLSAQARRVLEEKKKSMETLSISLDEAARHRVISVE